MKAENMPTFGCNFLYFILINALCSSLQKILIIETTLLKNAGMKRSKVFFPIRKADCFL